MEMLERAVAQLKVTRSEMAAERDNLRRLFGRLEVGLRGYADEVGTPDPYSDSSCLAVRNDTRPEGEHVLTITSCGEWVVEIGISDRERNLADSEDSVHRGLYAYTNLRGSKHANVFREKVQSIIGLREEDDRILFLCEHGRDKRTGAREASPYHVLSLLIDFIRNVEVQTSFELANYNPGSGRKRITTARD